MRADALERSSASATPASPPGASTPARRSSAWATLRAARRARAGAPRARRARRPARPARRRPARARPHERTQGADRPARAGGRPARRVAGPARARPRAGRPRRRAAPGQPPRGRPHPLAARWSWPIAAACACSPAAPATSSTRPAPGPGAARSPASDALTPAEHASPRSPPGGTATRDRRAALRHARTVETHLTHAFQKLNLSAREHARDASPAPTRQHTAHPPARTSSQRPPAHTTPDHHVIEAHHDRHRRVLLHSSPIARRGECFALLSGRGPGR